MKLAFKSSLAGLLSGLLALTAAPVSSVAPDVTAPVKDPLSVESLGLMPHMYSLLQLSNRIADTDGLTAGMGTGILANGELAMNADGTASAALIAHASQYFELIEDPLLNLLVPVIIQIVMGIIRTPIINVVSEILGSVLAQLLAKPLAEAIMPGVDTSSMSKVEDAMAPKSPAGIRASNSSSTTTTTTTETVEGFFLQLDEDGRPTTSTTRDVRTTGTKKLERIVDSLSEFIEVASAEAGVLGEGRNFTLRWKPQSLSSSPGSPLRVEVLERVEELLRQRGWSMERIKDVTESHARTYQGGEDGNDQAAQLSETAAEKSDYEDDEEEQEEEDDEEFDDLPPEDAPHPGLHLDDLWRQYYRSGDIDDDGAAYASFLELHTSATPCSAAKSLEACHRMAPPVMKGRGCSWCYKGDSPVGKAAGKCVPCNADKVKNFVSKGGLTCSRDANICALHFQGPKAMRPVDYHYHLTEDEKTSKNNKMKRMKWEISQPRAYEQSVASPQPPQAASSSPAATPTSSPAPTTTPTPSTSVSPLPAGVVPHNGASVRKDWVPSDETRFPKMPPKVKGKPPENEATQQVVRTITDDVVIAVSHTLHAALVPLLRKKLTDKLSRHTVRETTAQVTNKVVSDLHATLPMELIEQITLLATRDLSAEVTHTLTEALVPTITESIARNPGVDLMCFLCRSEARVYCDACKLSINQDKVNSDAAWRIAQEKAIKAKEWLLGPQGSGIVESAVAKSIQEETKGVIEAVSGGKKKKKKNK
jgi:hypothetical protein